MEVIPFKPVHLLAIEHRWPEVGIAPDLMLSTAKHYAIGFARTGLVNGRPIVCGGMMKLWPGVGETWVIGSDELKQNVIPFQRAILRFREVVFGMGLHRLQCACHVDFTDSRKWLERLGFVDEGLMKAFASDRSDYVRYAIIR